MGRLSRPSKKRHEVEKSGQGIEAEMKNEAVSLRLVESLFHLVLRSLSFSLERVSVPVDLSTAPLLDLLAIPDRVEPSSER